MNYRFGGRFVHLTLAALLLAALGASAAAQTPETGYLLEDGRVTGVNLFLVEPSPSPDEQVLVVHQDFKFVIGDRVLSGKDAVIWSKDQKIGEITRHRLVVYIEGQALVQEPDGATTSDRTMIVNINLQGRLTAAGKMKPQPAANLPILKRAAEARYKAEHPAPPPVKRRPPVRVAKAPSATAPAQAAAPTTGAAAPVARAASAPTTGAAAVAASAPAAQDVEELATTAPADEGITTVTISADLASSLRLDRAALVVTGKVDNVKRLSQDKAGLVKLVGELNVENTLKGAAPRKDMLVYSYISDDSRSPEFNHRFSDGDEGVWILQRNERGEYILLNYVLPAQDEAKVRQILSHAGAGAPAAQTAVKGSAKTPAKPADLIQPVYYSSDEPPVTQEVSPGVLAIILRGNVYVSQGSSESDQFLQMRCQSAVVFIERNAGKKDVRSPLSPKVKSFGANQSVTGVYLENDVQISRGERSMRATRAYYDMTTDRAIISDPVFRTVQEQRNVPIYIRAKEARVLSAREMYFKDARVSTSDFYTPSYSIGAKEVRFKDATPYDSRGQQIGQQNINAQMKDVTYNVEDFPILYWPYASGDFGESDSPLKRVSVGNNGKLGTGVETDWDLFRLLGLIPPSGVKAGLELDVYKRGYIAGVNVEYARREENRQYTGYALAYGMIDNDGEDSFGDDREDIPAPTDRGRFLARHKEYLPKDWEVQFEVSYLSDRNFLEEFFRNEYWAGKEQETLLYAKKQRDNWAFTALLQYRLNDFLTQTESWPDLSYYMIGQPLADGKATFFNEDHLGLKRFQPDKDSTLQGSDVMGRADTRNEVDVPLKAGPVNVTPYATGRLTGWSDKPDGGDNFRPYGQTGVKSNMDIWRVYNDAYSRLWDVNRLKHIMTPEVAGWVAGSGVNPGSRYGTTDGDIFPMDPGIEYDTNNSSGGTIGLYQRLQTKRGLPGKEKTVDWMRLDVVAAFFNKTDENTLPADGRFFFDRPENSLARNAVNVDYAWNISDATALLASMNYDVKSSSIGRGDIGFAVQRDPRLRYYVGLRYINELDVTAGTFGFNYKLSNKYSISVFEQYDFTYDGGKNLTSNVSLIRKFERWYAGVTFEFDPTEDGAGIYLTVWPDGIPEVKVGSGRTGPLGTSSMN